MFGAPISASSRGAGSVWRYRYEETARADTGMLSRIGAAVAGILGRRVVRSPVDVAHQRRVVRELEIRFDTAGVVEDYQYDVREEPSTRVY